MDGDAAGAGVDGAGPDEVGPDPLGDIAPSAVELLDAAALGGIARRTGARSQPRDGGRIEPAPAHDEREPAPATATQLLDLLLGAASMAGIHRNDLLVHWCDRCATTGHRVPDELLVRLLEHATAASPVQAPVRRVLGGRGWWLAAQNPLWGWATPTALDAGGPGGEGATAPDPHEWALLPSARRVEVLADVRHRDPAAGRDLLLTSWSSDSAAARAAHLAVLADGLGPDDEELLEAALDDRSKVVRAQANVLLDGLAGSARARRMAERLRPLLSIEGRRRSRSIVVTLPDDPDEAGARDGLVPPPGGRSARGFWIEQLVAGAPLSVWTDLTGDDADATVALLATGGADADVRAGMLRAVLARRDPVWAAALHRSVPDPRLLDLLPVADRVDVIGRMLQAKKPPTGVHLATLIDHLPAPWSPALSSAVVRSLRADANAATVQAVTPILARSLDASAQGAIEGWLRSLEEQPHLAAALRTLVQYQSLHRSITEAFP